MKTGIFNAFKGMAMGIAEVIPGVSGGTIAFITGIYERLLDAINGFRPSLIKTLRKEGFGAFWKQIDGNFLASLMGGMAFGVVVGVFAISFLLENYPVLIWAFFFGLIIASAIYIARQIKKWGPLEIILLIIGTALAYWITISAPTNGNEALWFVFLSGAIAICALILPGISGSFILLLLGMYGYVIPTVKNALKTQDPQSLLVMGVFGAGCLFGLFSFAKAMSWTFKTYKFPTLALLTGFMLGSLNKIWPWRQETEWLRDAAGNIIIDDEGHKKVISEINLLPGNYEALTGQEAYLLLAIVLAIVGFASVFLLERLSEKPAEEI